MPSSNMRPACSACLTEMPDLVELQRRNPDRFVILGVSLDGVADEHGHNHRPILEVEARQCAEHGALFFASLGELKHADFVQGHVWFLAETNG